MESARIDDAVELVEQARAKLEKAPTAADEGSVRRTLTITLHRTNSVFPQLRELNLIHQRIAFQFLFSTRFEDAGKHFLAGDADPRLLVRLFPDLRGSLITPSDELEVFSGIAEKVKAFDSIDDIGEQSLSFYPA